MTSMQGERIKEILATKPSGRQVTVNGWVRTRRDAKGFSFLEIHDGSCLAGLQVIADPSLANYQQEVRKLTTGCSVRVRGLLTASPARGQEVELRAETVQVYGWADPASYPLQKKRHSYEFLRTIPHLRARTNSLGAVARLRNVLAQAIHRFFQERGFQQIHTPLITTSDCEGAGETFTVTALDLAAPAATGGGIDFGQDLFGRKTALTVSGQLEAEAYALALGRVYTFGPAFRAENSNTSRHLAEFWMVEPEIAFCDLNGAIDLAEALLTFLVRHLLDHCQEDLALFSRFVEPGLPARLELLASKKFARLSYDEAIRILATSGRDFEFPVAWGMDLHSEHERFLAEQEFKRPVVVTDYPRQIKPFYMRLNPDQRTVAAMDILVPGIGELVGGSQREERYPELRARMEEAGLDLTEYQWYLDLRRYGTAPHAGFGLGFERLIQLVTGLANIREAIPFPRTPGTAC